MKWFRYRDCPPGEQGSITPILALALVAVVGAMAVSIDLGQLFLVRNDLQNVADAAALAGAKKLLQDKNNDGVPEVYCDEAIQAAIDVANKNFSFGSDTPVKLTAANVTLGKWNLSTKQFDREGCSADPILVNAVKVTVNRDGQDNSKVSTFFGSVLGVGTQDIDPDTLIKTGPAKLSAGAASVALLGLAGTSAIDIPFAVPKQYTAGQGSASNGLQRMLDRFAPAPAYAASQHYKWYDKADGGTSSTPALIPTRATWTVASASEFVVGATAYYAMQKYLQGTRFPQKQVGDKLYPVTENIYGQYLIQYFQWMQAKWKAKKNPATGKWRVTVPVFSPTPVTSSLPQNSWIRLALRLLPGVSQANACLIEPTPVVYCQGFATIDITNVYVKSGCNQANNGTTQKTDPNSCRNTCYMEFDVPLDLNTVSTDKGSNPIPYQKDYKDMFNPANEIGVFAAVPRLVK